MVCNSISALSTQINSSSEKIISSRFQEHSFVTRDGLLHVVVNDGSAFSIMSQVHLDDGSISWVETARFIGINDLDTSDLVLQEDTLYFANSAKGRRIDIRSLDYDLLTGEWTVRGTFSESFQNDSYKVRIKSPSLALNDDGDLAFAFSRIVEKDGSTRANVHISLLERTADEFKRADSYLTIKAPLDIKNLSGRLMADDDEFSLITLESTTPESSAKGTMSWRTIVQDPVTGVFIQGQPSFMMSKDLDQLDPSGTHYSVLEDKSSNHHLLSNDGAGHLVYLRKSSAAAGWQHVPIDDSLSGVAYMQLSLLNDGSLLALSVSKSSQFRPGKQMNIHRSSDLGLSWSTIISCHDEKLSMGNPRLEIPAFGLNTPNWFQQIDVDGLYQSLLLWEMSEPISTPTPISEPIPTPAPTSEPLPTPTPIPTLTPTPTPLPILIPTPIPLPKSIPLSDKSITSFTPAEIEFLKSEDIDVLTLDFVEGISAYFFAQLEADAIQGFGSSQVEKLPNDVFSVITSSQLKVLVPNALKGLQSEQLFELKPKLFKSLSSEQVAAISKTTFASMSKKQMKRLSVNVVNGITHQQLRTISSDEISVFKPKKIGAIDPDAISGLKPRTLDALNKKRTDALSKDQLQGLTHRQRNKADDFMAKLSKKQVGFLSLRDNLNETSSEMPALIVPLFNDSLTGFLF